MGVRQLRPELAIRVEVLPRAQIYQSVLVDLHISGASTVVQEDFMRKVIGAKSKLDVANISRPPSRPPTVNYSDNPQIFWIYWLSLFEEF